MVAPAGGEDVAGAMTEAGGLEYLVLGLENVTPPLEEITEKSYAASYAVEMLASGFAIAAWQANVSRLGANKVLVYMYLVTLVGLAASVLLLGENLGAGKVAGAAAILLGVYLARRA